MDVEDWLTQQPTQHVDTEPASLPQLVKKEIEASPTTPPGDFTTPDKGIAPIHSSQANTEGVAITGGHTSGNGSRAFWSQRQLSIGAMALQP